MAAESAAELVAALKQGGHVLFLRHASRDGKADPRPVGPTDCARQSQLSDEGREEARRLGAAFRRLGIPVGSVFSSQYCRCTDTAEFAFGRFITDPGLNAFYRVGLPQEEVERRVAALRRLVSTAPPAGQNVVVVGHGWHYVTLTGRGNLATAEAAVFMPTGSGYREVGRLTLADLERPQ